MTRGRLEPCVFLDRDGTLIEDVGYTYKPEALVWLPGVPEALSALKAAGFRLIVVTNQSGVARGYYSEAEVHAFHQHMNAQLGSGAAIDAFYYCPYHADAIEPAYARNLHMRKPDIGMFERARIEHPVDVARSFMIGDRLLDMEFARRAGLRAILIAPSSQPAAGGFATAHDFGQAAKYILEHRAKAEPDDSGAE